MNMKYKLKDIFDLQMGKTPSRNHTEYWNTKEHKWISIAILLKLESIFQKLKSAFRIVPLMTVDKVSQLIL